MSDPLVVRGRAWLFGEDNLNTDLMMPQTVFGKSLESRCAPCSPLIDRDGLMKCKRGTSWWVGAISEPDRVVRLLCF